MEEKPAKTDEKVATGHFKEGFDPRRNYEGRPKGAKSFTTKVREAMEKIAEGKDYTYEEAFIKAILKKAIVDQDTPMMRTIWEQFDGKPIQRTDLTTAGKELPTPILGNDYVIPGYNGDQEDNSADEEN